MLILIHGICPGDVCFMSKNSSIINGISLICGIVGALCVFLSRMLSGNPLDMIHKLDGLNVIPPIWIFNFLSVIWYFLIGAAVGLTLKELNNGHSCGQSAIAGYRGIAFFLITFFVCLIWYPTFFSAQAIFISFVMCLAVCISAVCCAYNWFFAKVKIAALIMTAYSVWSLYILIINLSVLFGI